MTTRRFSRWSRDSGLRRVSTITGWTAAGAIVGTGFFAGLASHSVPASTRSGAATTAGRASTVTTLPTDDGGNGNGNGTGTGFSQTPAVPPTGLPTSAGGFTPIVSGAS